MPEAEGSATRKAWTQYWENQKIIRTASDARDPEDRIAAIELLDPEIHSAALNTLLFFEQDPTALQAIIKRLHCEIDTQ